MTNLAISVALGTIAGSANILGGILLVRRSPSSRTLRLFVALGAGFMLSTVFLEMLPEAFAIGAPSPAILILLGYCLVHLLEHAVVAHLHVADGGEDKAKMSEHTGYSVLFGLAAHTFFDGVAVGSGFLLSRWLGWIIFLAIILHKVPEGVTVASFMLAARQGRRAALGSTLILAVTTVAGALTIAAFPSLVRVGLPLSAGATMYVATSDLVPEVNRHTELRNTLAFFAGVLSLVLLKRFAPI